MMNNFSDKQYTKFEYKVPLFCNFLLLFSQLVAMLLILQRTEKRCALIAVFTSDYND